MTKRSGISSLPGHELPFKIQRNQSPFLYRILSSSLLKDVANYCHAVIAIRSDVISNLKVVEEWAQLN